MTQRPPSRSLLGLPVPLAAALLGGCVPDVDERPASPGTAELGISAAASWTSTEGDDARDLAFGDYDGDGDLDVAVAVVGGPTRVYQATGSAYALVWSAPETADDSHGVDWGDWDGDGDLDLGVANAGQANRVYGNNGGTFSLVWSAPEASDDSRDLAFADWDGDGDLDLAVVNGSSQPDRVYARGASTLSLAWTSPEADDGRALAWADYDGDGDPDLAIGNSSVSLWDRVYKNTGGALTSVWTSPQRDDTNAVAWGDWNGDGDVDLATIADGYDRVYDTKPGDSFTLGWSSTLQDDGRGAAWGDFDGDGHLDLAVASDAADDRVYLGDGQSTLTSGWTSGAGATSRAVAWGDHQADGDLDLAFAGAGATLRVHANAGTATTTGWTSAGLHTHDVSLGDFDGDGDLDAAVAVSWGQNQVFANDGSGVFTSVWTGTFADNTHGCAWGDWDGDGDLDLVFVNKDGTDRIYSNDGAGTLTLAWSSSLSEKSQHAAWADWDNDGDLDLAVGVDGADRVYQNNGGVLVSAWTSAGTGKAEEIAWGDFDGDGDPDLALGRKQGPDVVYENTGAGLGATPVWTAAATTNTRAIAWADYDGDGDLDLTAGISDAPVEIYANTGGTLSTTPTWTSGTSYTTRDIAWFDYDGDGDLDLWVANDQQDDQLFTNDAGVLTLAMTTSGEPDNSKEIAPGDLDNDGDIDVLMGTHYEALRVYTNGRNHGAARPQDPTRVSVDRPVGTQSAAHPYASALRVTGAAVVPFTLYDADGDPATVRLEYTTAGSAQWSPATVTSPTAGLATSAAGTQHTLTWDLVADAVADDAVVARVVVDVQAATTVGGPLQTATVGAGSPPFRGYGCWPWDADGDGVGCATDCDDANPAVYPGAPEVADDGIDQDCSGADTVTCFVDVDGDGFGGAATLLAADGDCLDPGESPVATDCDDAAGGTFPGAAEIADDGIDQDCSGADTVTCFVDVDGDGVGGTSTVLAADGDCTDPGESSLSTDCDDGAAAVFPGAAEIADDGIDQDCSGADTVTCFVDADGDGFGSSATLLAADGDCLDAGEATVSGDCDDGAPATFPGAVDPAGDGVDQNCDGTDTATCYVDGDGDGIGAGAPVPSLDGDCTDAGEAAAGGDCDDGDASVFPGASEIVDDGIDQDCSGADTVTCFVDADGDGYGTSPLLAADGACTDPGEAALAGDCDDGAAGVFPGAVEQCDAVDSNCDGDLVDDFEDFDVDGLPDCTDDDDDDDGALDVEDCDPLDAAVFPGAEEECDMVDSDCDGDLVDDFDDLDASGLPDCMEVDEDGDGVLASLDCDDGDASVFPGADEVPDDGVDQDCSGTDTVTCLEDLDGDGFGSDLEVLAADGDCDDEGETAAPGDCDDDHHGVSPAEPEVCDNGLDDDCDGAADDLDDDCVEEEIEDPLVDRDGDGWCPAGVDRDGDGDCDDEGEAEGTFFDCDDDDPEAHPGALETCEDGVDQDCDGTETAIHDDPECWGMGCASAGRGAPPALWFLALLVPMVPRRRLPGLLFVALLLAPAAASAGEVREARAALEGGDCAAALFAAADLQGAEAHRLRGDAHRCLGSTREAAVAYRTFLDLAGPEPSVQALIDQLRSALARLEVRVEGTPATESYVSAEFDGGVAHARVVDGTAAFVDLPAQSPLRLTLAARGVRGEPIDVDPIAPGETAAVTMSVEAVGLARVELSKLAVAAVQVRENGSHVVVMDTPVEVTAGRAEVEIESDHGRVSLEVDLPAGKVTTLDPAPLLPASLTVSGIPAGSAARVFVEGSDGRMVNREFTPPVAGSTLDLRSGVRVASPVLLRSLPAGSGGLFVTHPVLGTQVVSVTIEAGRRNAVAFEWERLAGVPSLATTFERYRAERARERADAARLPTVGAIAAAILGGAGAGLAVGAKLAQDRAAGARDQALADTAAAPGLVSDHWADWSSALQTRDGLLVGAGTLGALSVTGAGFSIAFGVKARDAEGAYADWTGAESGPAP